MKRYHFQILFLVLFWSIMQELAAQDVRKGMKMPVTISVFSESVSMPNFRGFFENPNLGFRIGTEFYYRQHSDRQTFQTLHLGYYHHDGLHQGIFVSTEFGYRRFIGKFSADVTIGVGYLHLISDLRRYEPDGDGYSPASQRLHKVMPTLGLGLGYRVGEVTIFSRFEMFGEMPFNSGGSPVLPHKALHFGARFYPFSN